MARLWSSGAELNSATANVEFTASVNSPTIITGTQRSGIYAVQIDNNEFVQYRVASSSVNGSVRYLRVYVRFSSFPDADKRLVGLPSGLGVYLDSVNRLKLVDGDLGDVGSPSSILSTNTWYKIEVRDRLGDGFDDDGLADVEFRLAESTIASGTNLSGGGDGVNFTFGANSPGTYTCFFDDIAINDDSGSFQNSWPGEGKIIHLRPNAEGDTQSWTSPTNPTEWEEVSEVTPDDASSLIQTSTNNAVAEFELDATPAEIGVSDTINVVQVGFRFRRSTSSLTAPSVVLRIKSASGGTVEESASITFSNGTSWATNAPSNPRNHPLTLYDLPGASTDSWTKATLDTAQIGARLTNSPFGFAQISTMWLLVDHTPTAAEEADSPTVVTSTADQITFRKFRLNGEVTDDGGDTIIRRGFVFDISSQSDPGNTDPDESAYDFMVSETGSFTEETFTASLTGEKPGVQFFARAFAENSAGFSYGDEVSFFTTASPFPTHYNP